MTPNARAVRLARSEHRAVAKGPEPIYRALGRRLRRARGTMTQAQAAERLGVTRQQVALWESGGSRVPLHRVHDMALLYGTTIADLINHLEDDRSCQPSDSH